MGEKGLIEEDWNGRKVEEKEKIIVKWAQGDVETSNNLLNNNMVLSMKTGNGKVGRIEN